MGLLINAKNDWLLTGGLKWQCKATDPC